MLDIELDSLLDCAILYLPRFIKFKAISPPLSSSFTGLTGLTGFPFRDLFLSLLGPFPGK